MNKGELLYSGKAKSVFYTDHPDHLLLSFRDDTSAFDGKKMTALARKGAVNNQFNAWIMTQLAQAGIATHFVQLLSAQESLVLNLDMIPVECVVRNRVAGGLMRRLSLTEGAPLSPPVFELFLKDDALGDPMINDSHAITFGWASADELAQMKVISLQVNEVLTRLFADAGLILVDYKLEFGRYQGQIVLGDEFSPDGCRLWDAETLDKMDKDRFRQDLGNVIEAYEEVGRRLGITFIDR
jgi:phosphoribosylaminoimidazole-succinocarboxamide synthase